MKLPIPNKRMERPVFKLLLRHRRYDRTHWLLEDCCHGFIFGEWWNGVVAKFWRFLGAA